MLIKAIPSRLFTEREVLEAYVLQHIPRLKEGSILCVTSKIVALAQGRVAANTRGAKTRWIKKESEQAIKTKWCYLTLKEGHWCPNAGIDESNANGKLILWPDKSYEVAQTLRKALQKKFRLKKLGILITDSRVFPLRAGVVGVALAYAGFKGLRDYRGKPDLFGKKLALTQTNIADTLASAAVMVMGEGRERQPLAVIESAPVVFVSKVDPTELCMDPAGDLYRPLFSKE